jgi:hypothetical protein
VPLSSHPSFLISLKLGGQGKSGLILSHLWGLSWQRIKVKSTGSGFSLVCIFLYLHVWNYKRPNGSVTPWYDSFI